MEYIRSGSDERGVTDGACVFCVIPDREPERVLATGATAYIVLNKFPYNPGHLLVVPLRHVGDLEELSPDEILELLMLCPDHRAKEPPPPAKRHPVQKELDLFFAYFPPNHRLN